ncbi:hypothetical protein BGZ79_001199, partial [Entomortierella chlamydospora]
MAFNFDSSFSLDQAGLELSLSDFAFDPAQANQVRQQLQLQQQQQQQKQQQQEQQQLQNLLLRDDPSHSHSIANDQIQSQHNLNENIRNSFHSSLNVDMMNAAPSSATTTPVFQTNPDLLGNNNSNNNSSSSNNHHTRQTLQQQLQQQHQQQQYLLQQHQQRQQHQLHQRQQHQLQQLPQAQKDGARQQLLTPAGSERYQSDYSQYISPLSIQPEKAAEAAMTLPDQFDDDE